MEAKTTSDSGFNFPFVFYTMDFVRNLSNIENFIGALFEIFGVKVEKFEKFLKKHF